MQRSTQSMDVDRKAVIEAVDRAARADRDVVTGTRFSVESLGVERRVYVDGPRGDCEVFEVHDRRQDAVFEVVREIGRKGGGRSRYAVEVKDRG